MEMSASPFLDAAKELTADLQAAGVTTVRGLMQWLEVSHQADLASVIEDQTAHALLNLSEKGVTSVAVVVAYSLALGARLRSKGLL